MTVAVLYANRVLETTSNKPDATPSDFNLSGAKTGFRTIVAGIATGNYSIFLAEEVDGNGNPAGAWEIFLGKVTDAAPDTLTRVHLVDSSTGSFIDWSAVGVNASPDVSIVNPAQVVAHSALNMAHDASRFYGMPTEEVGGSSQTVIANRIYLTPVHITQVTRLGTLTYEVTVAATDAAGSLDATVGLYATADGDPLTPTTRLYSEELTDGVATTGAKVSGDIDKYLDPGWYWLAVMFEGGTNLKCQTYAQTNLIQHWAGLESSLSKGVQAFYFNRTYSLGLPSPWSGTISEGASTKAPRMYFSPKAFP